MSVALALIIVMLLLWVVLAAPIGTLRLGARVAIDAEPGHIWQAVYPFGEAAGWNGEITSAKPLERDGQIAGHMVTAHVGRDGAPIEREFVVEDLVPERRFRLRFIADSSLDQSFWQHHHYDLLITPTGSGRCDVSIAETDRYRGVAFAVYRFFALRRLSRKLKIWAEKGTYRKGGLFERPITQFAMACLSALMLWPLFGLDRAGLFLAATLTAVVALHELGHVAAFRIAGHASARMIFIPVLGGIAMGGRPYDTRFEVGFAALMGAGFSAFLAVLLMGTHVATSGAMTPWLAQAVATIALICAAFNLGNLAPVWRFDGGQVIRQLFETRVGQALASAVLLMALAAAGMALDLPYHVLMIGAVVLAILSVMTSGSGVRPKKPLTPMTATERLGLGGAFAATVTIHALVLVWSADLLLA